ncbi:MAG: hypothetical protein ACFE8L_13075 [Candidatus Hodarchaeota archaeon]
MSGELLDKIKLVNEYLHDFTNFIELENFRSFLLFTLTSQVPSNILAQIGLGGPKEIINLPYNPIFDIYYQKINLISAGALIIYVKADPISNNFILEKDDSIIKNYLNPNEISLAFRGKEKFLLPKISDCSAFNDERKSKINIKIDDLFHSLESFLAVSEPNLLFVIDAKTDSQPDLIFTFNMMPELPKLDQKVLKVDVYLDYSHKTRDITYLKREEDYNITYLKDIKEVSHADLYKSLFSLILHIKSLNEP